MVSHRFALLPGADRMVKVKAAVPQRIPQFVRQLVELVVLQGARLDHEHDIDVRARTDLSTGERADGGEPHAMIRHVKRY